MYTSPFSVNLIALLVKLSKTCSSLNESPFTKTGILGSLYINNSIPFLKALYDTIDAKLSNKSSILNSICSISILPDSNLEKSRISLTMESRFLEELSIFSA